MPWGAAVQLRLRARWTRARTVLAGGYPGRIV